MQKCKILIVEDELITRQALRYILGLEAEMFEVIGEARNGKEAQDLIEKEVPHIVLCDIVMPIMDGIELTKYIKLKYPDIYVIILSSHSDFDYVKATFKYGVFDYILKPQLEPQVLLSLLFKISKSLNIEGKIKEVHIEPKVEEIYLPYFCMIGCNLTKVQGFRKSKVDFYFEEMANKVTKRLNNIRHKDILMEEHYFVSILNFEEDFLAQIDRQTKQIAEEMHQINHSWSLAKGEIFEDCTHQIEHMQEIKEIIDTQFYQPYHRLILQKNPHRKGDIVEFNHKEYTDKIQRGIYGEAFEMLMDFLGSIDERCMIKEQELKKVVENSIYNTINLLEEQGVNLEEISSKKLILFNKINAALNIEELRRVVKEIIREITVKMDGYQKTENAIVSKMYRYIDQHYNEQITLNTLANVFHLSYSYLSCYFSQTTNKGFNEYLNEVRINRAKELLRYSKDSISEISEQVGYADQSYFSKVFRKITTYSPSEYRRIHSR